jgi:hypothetical protein
VYVSLDDELSSGDKVVTRWNSSGPRACHRL